MNRIPSSWQRFVVALFGRVKWDAPPWLSWSGKRVESGVRVAAANPIATGVGLVVLALLIAGYVWYASLPKPHYVKFAVTPPSLTTYNDEGVPQIKPLRVMFSESAAQLKLVRTAVQTGIEMSPAIAGTWFWLSDRELTFTPKDDWPVNGNFSVRLPKTGLFSTQTTLEDYRFKFRSEPFAARIAESSFYQDPSDPNLKKLVATVAFSHPVDPPSLEAQISYVVTKEAEYLGLAPGSRNFTVAYDKFKLQAFVHSTALAMPRDDTPMTLRVDKGVRAARGGNDTTDRLEATVMIPGRASLKFSDARMMVVDNARYEPEQILMMRSSSPVAERSFGDKISVRLLPVRHPQQPAEDKQPYDWRDAEIGTDILAASQEVKVNYVPAEEGGDTSHGFKFTAPVGRYLHVLVKDNVQGTGGYVSGKPYTATIKVGPYPQALTFLGQGALLSLSGDRKVGFLVRDITEVQVEIGRVLPDQLQHLAPAMYDYAKPGLYDGLEDKLVERTTTKRTYNAKPGTPTYDSIDLSSALQASRRGLYLLHLRGLRGNRPADAEGAEGEDEYRGGYGGGALEDTRLILVTDLGFIVKRAKDGSRDVFVQSIRSGLPVAAARVELVGSNGQPVLTAVTDANGRAQLAAPPREANREKQPQMVVVEKDADMAFLPFNTYRQRLDMSRYDTGGVVSAESAQQVSSYLFSDRGIYRPGETTHLGVITKTADWRASLGGLPIEIEISDPRGLVIKKQQMNISAGAFDEIEYTAPAAAPTGTYEAAAYLPREQPRRRELLGTTTFKVQEFEPDRMKVLLELSPTPVAGWLRPADVKAKVTVAHLFGEPASNRRVDGELSLTPALPRFTKYQDYRFQIGEALKEPYHETLAALTTDGAGSAEFNLDLKRFTGRAFRLNVLSRAYEAEGGRNVAAQNNAIVSDAAYLVGVKPDGDLTFVRRSSDRSAHWLAVNQELNPVAAGDLTLEWVQKKFVSVLTQQDNGTLKYVSRPREIIRTSRTGVNIPVAGASFPLPTDEPGDFMLVLRDNTGAKLNTLSYSVAGEANVSRSLDRDAELQVQLDRAAYGPGDTIEVSIRAPYVGAGLITVERERVFKYQWFKTTTTSSVQRITLPEDFEGNGYVSVQFVRDPASDELFMSPLSYGVAPFAPDLSARTQRVTLDAPKQVKPGEVLTMRLTPGEASRVAVLAVDEGILQVARYRNPDPLGYFFQKRMLEVDTTQILDLILPDFKRFVALSAPGGDADGGFARHLNPFNRKRKAPVAYWSGVIDVGPEGRDLKYTVPDYFNGKLRIVAIVASPRRVGVSDVATEVKGEFILTPNVPPTTTPGDEFIVSVGVFNNTTGGNGPIKLEAKLGPGLELLSAPSMDLQIADKKEGVGEFRLKANPSLGSASMTFSATRGTSEAHVEETVGVRPAAQFRTTLTLGRVDGANVQAPLTRDMYGPRRVVEAAVSTMPIVWGRGLTAFLDNYEYTCTEQLVSKGVSALMVVTHPEFGAIRNRQEDPLAPTYSTIRGRMNDEGGLGLWSSSPMTAELPTIYAAHFLIESRDRGQRIPQEVLFSINGWLTQFASTPANTLEAGRMRAYAVYLLARQGQKPTAQLANVEQELTNRYAQAWKTDLAAAYIASTYRLMQRTEDADRIVRAVPWANVKRDFGEDDVYYDPVVHDAQLLYLVAKHFPTRLGQTPSTVLEAMSVAVSGNKASSLSAAYTLLALDAFSKTAAGSMPLGITEIGKDGRERALTLPESIAPKVAIAESAAKVQFSKRGPLIAYYVVNESGFDRNPPAADISQGVEIVREFVDANGNVLPRVKVGDEFFVRVRVRSTTRERVPQVAVVDLLPGGLEPVLELQPAADTSTPGEDPAMQRQRGAARALPIGVTDKSDWHPYHVDVREDRVILYGDVGRNVRSFTYRVRATNAGTFVVPPAFAEGMYNRTISGLSKGATLEVIKP